MSPNNIVEGLASKLSLDRGCFEANKVSDVSLV